MATTFELYDGSETVDLTDSAKYVVQDVGFFDFGRSDQTIAGANLRSLKFLPYQIDIALGIKGTNLIDLRTNIRNLNTMLRRAEARQINGEGTDVLLQWQLGDTDAEDVHQRVLSGQWTPPRGIVEDNLVDQSVTLMGNLSLVLDPFGHLDNVRTYGTVVANEQDGASLNYIDLQAPFSSYLTFDGASGEVDCGSAASIDNPFDGGGSFEAWVYPRSDGESDEGRIIDKGLWSLTVEDESAGLVKVVFDYSFDTLSNPGQWKTTTRVIPINTWSHVAVTFDADSASNDPVIYLNGVAQTIEETDTPSGTRDTDAAAVLTIGNTSTGSRTWDGHIDEVRLWDDVRTAAEILANYISEIDPTTAGLIGYWRLNEGTGSTAFDSHSNGNDGTITGTAWGIGTNPRGTSGARTEVRVYDENNGGGNAWGGSNKMWLAIKSGERRSDSLFIQAADSFVSVQQPTTVDITFNSGVTGGPTASASGGASSYLEYDNDTGAGRTLKNTSNYEGIAYAQYDISTLPRGRYRVLVRASIDETTAATQSQHVLGIGYAFGGFTKSPTEGAALADTDFVAFDNAWATDEWHTMDIGEIIIPPVGTPENTIASDATLNLRVYWGMFLNGVSWADATHATIGLDYVMLLPVDEGVVVIDDVDTDDRILISNIDDIPGVWKMNSSDVIQSLATFNGGPFPPRSEPWRLYWVYDDPGDPTNRQANITVVHKPLVQGVTG
jgi:hypothetical protein